MYAKPEVAVLGKAVSVIEVIGKGGFPSDGSAEHQATNPAYDLDE
jgi:hypothetical protein